MSWDKVPIELKEKNRWICWKAVPKGNGKIDKPPINTQTGRIHDPLDSRIHVPFIEAVEAAKRFDVSGIGFVFCEEDNLFGVDLDNCIQDGILQPEAARIVNALTTYCEISPSGTGIKLFAKGRLPGPNKNTQFIEAYDHNRYFTVTGNVLNGISNLENREYEFRPIYYQYFPEEIPKAGGLFRYCYLLKFLLQKTRAGINLDHKMRLGLASIGNALGELKTEEMPFISAILRGCPDFDIEITRKQVKSLDDGAPPWGCDKLRETVAEFFKEFQTSECLKHRQTLKGKNPSPILFAEKNDSKEGESRPSTKRTNADILIEIASQSELFHDPHDTIFANFEVEDHHETWPVRSIGFKRFLSHQFYEQEGKPPNSQSLADALRVIEAKGQFKGPQKEVFGRIGGSEDAIYIDLVNDEWSAVEITNKGWKVVSNPPIHFKRSKGMRSLPYPQDGSLEDLKPFLNLSDSSSWHLIAGWLIGAIRPTGPYPIIVFQGEQGSAKSTASRILKSILDPSSSPLRTTPKGVRDLMIAANNSWILSFDNLSGIPVWLSDCLCRLATGGGFATRTLYENDEETIFDAVRPQILNGITDIVTRHDLSDRAIIVNLEPISEQARRPERELWSKFRKAQPQILGALCSAVSHAIKNIGSVTLDEKPRMADFAYWVTAAEKGLNWRSGEFISTYQRNVTDVVQLTLETDIVSTVVREFMDGRDEWKGRPSELLEELEQLVSDSIKRSKHWPKAPHSLTSKLKRATPFLRKVGIGVEFYRVKNARYITLRKTPRKSVTSVTDNEKSIQHIENNTNNGVTLQNPKASPITLQASPSNMLESFENDAGDAGDASFPHLSKSNVNLIRDEKSLIEKLDNLKDANRVGVDIETDGLDPRTNSIVTIQFATDDDNYVVDVSKIKNCSDRVSEALFSGGPTKLFHNSKFDLSFFGNPDCTPLFDTFLAERLITAGFKEKASLEVICKKYLNIDVDKSQQTSFKCGAEFTGDQIRYAALDAAVLLPIYEIQKKKLADEGLVETALLEFSIVPDLVRIERKGMLLDRDYLRKLEIELNDRRHKTETELKQYSDINSNSPVQVKDVLNDLGFQVKSTGIEVLQTIAHPFAEKLVEYRKISKEISSFINALPKHIHPVTGRIHPEFFQLGANTGRFTCSKPNLQQIPKEQKWRDLFISPDGYKIITADYSQIELRILAEFSQDMTFLEAFRAGQDLHAKTAADIFGVAIDKITKEQRNVAKTINFGICYGMGASGLSKRLRISFQKAEKFINAYFRAYPQVKSTLQNLGIKTVKQGYSKTPLGRKRFFKSADSFSAQKSLERKGRNMPIQGTSADILKKAIYQISNDLRELDAAIINLVHDEIVIECRENIADKVATIVEQNMIGAGQYFIKSIPVVVEIVIDDKWRKYSEPT
jgi:DNA polymerase I-like protein with 3'-5' exonuclease and polymerase domains